jgi:TetR/AcrR family transcriptional regulator, regulator of cefoperazone and chloramphenicol sensitivity
MSNFLGPDWYHSVLHPQEEQGKRRLRLLEAAFDLITEVGFEGLRTRAVASRTGVNIATLHYYFPTKQKLIEGLAQFLGAKFVTIHGPSPAPSGFAALDRLRQEFSDTRYYLIHEPKMLTAIAEFAMRAKRDEQVQRVFEQMQFHWRQGLEQMTLEGIAAGVFRSDIDAEAVTSIVLAIFSGLAAVGADGIDGVERTIESWILSDAVKQQLEAERRGAKQ